MSTKTVNTLNVGDKVYYPTVEEIIEKEVEEIQKTVKGIRVGINNYRSRIEDSDYNAAISTGIYYPNASFKAYCIRMEDAVAEQRKLRIAALKELQDKANAALVELNEFTNKYFID